MADQLIAAEINCTTGEVTERPYTPEEIAEHETRVAQMEADRQAREAEAQRIADLKASAKAKLVAGQPLTEDEATVITL